MNVIPIDVNGSRVSVPRIPSCKSSFRYGDSIEILLS